MADETEETTEEIGIPENLRVKRRKYTMSEAAVEQRQNAAQQPKPGMLGKRNAFKHGRFASDFANRLRPCKSTCDKFPCELIEDGKCSPGDDCLDTAAVLEFFRAVHEAIKGDKEKANEDLNEIAALQLSNNLKIIDMLQEDLLRDGSVVKRETMTKFGLKVEYVAHPSLHALSKLTADLGLNLPEMLQTPRSKKRAETEEEGAKGLAAIMSKVPRNSQEEE